jgi:hypothetical protein
MSPSRYFIEIFHTPKGEESPDWHSYDHGTRQAAVSNARYWREQLGADKVALWDRSPTEINF